MQKLLSAWGKVMTLHLKAALLAVAVTASAMFSDIPVRDPWFWLVIILLLYRNLIGSIISGMPEPDEESTDWYIWAFRSLHLMDRKATTYFSHKSYWPFFEAGKKFQEGQEDKCPTTTRR